MALRRPDAGGCNLPVSAIAGVGSETESWQIVTRAESPISTENTIQDD